MDVTSSALASSLRRTSLDTADSDAGVAWQLTPLTAVPADWNCPDCGVRDKADFAPVVADDEAVTAGHASGGQDG